MRYKYSNAPSLIQGDVPTEEAYCFICHRPTKEFHHILNKTEKGFAENIGAWVWLCRGHHNRIHNTGDGQKLWRQWKADCQREYEKAHTREEWMSGAHRSYL